MKHKNLQIIHKNGQPYGIRDSGGYLLFFPVVSKFPGQEERYMKEINEAHELAKTILKALKEPVCPLCDGEGRRVFPNCNPPIDEECPACNGEGILNKTQ